MDRPMGVKYNGTGAVINHEMAGGTHGEFRRFGSDFGCGKMIQMKGLGKILEQLPFTERLPGVRCFKYTVFCFSIACAMWMLSSLILINEENKTPRLCV